MYCKLCNELWNKSYFKTLYKGDFYCHKCIKKLYEIKSKNEVINNL